MAGIKSLGERIERWPRDRLAERLSAASYGTVLVLASLALIDADDVSSGLGWELVTGVGIATWLAHLFAQVVGDHVRRRSPVDRDEFARAMADGIPIPLAAVAPALMLGLGRLGVVDEDAALWASIAIGIVQLAGVGAIVGSTVTGRGKGTWSYAAATAVFGLFVVTLKLALSH